MGTPVDTAEATDVEDAAKWARESLVCYAMLSGFEECTLGFGISLSFRGEVLVNARSPFEFLSVEAFFGDEIADGEPLERRLRPVSRGGRWVCAVCGLANSSWTATCLTCAGAAAAELFEPLGRDAPQGVRINSFSTERFTHFLPLYLTAEHFRADLCARCLQAAWCRLPAECMPEVVDEALAAEAAWHVLPALVNSTAVAMLGGDIHASDVAIRGCYSIHRLLLALSTAELRARAQEEVAAFACDPGRRTKIGCPNLGHFLPRLLLLEQPLQAWAQLKDALLAEAIDRTVLHAYRDFPALARVHDDTQYVEMRWTSAAKGLRMMVFIVRFLRHVSAWGSPDEVAAHYDRHFGQASSVEREAFRTQVAAIQQIDSWQAFCRNWRAEGGGDHGPVATKNDDLLAHLGGDAKEAAVVLRVSEQRSLQKRYFGGPPPMARPTWRRPLGLMMAVGIACLAFFAARQRGSKATFAETSVRA